MLPFENSLNVKLITILKFLINLYFIVDNSILIRNVTFINKKNES